jgi:mono/diheme cytochrome c family protein
MRLRSTLIAVSVTALGITGTLLTVFSGSAGTAAPPAEAARPAAEPAVNHFPAEGAPFLQKYCVGCHGGKKPKADLSLDTVTSDEQIRQERGRFDDLKRMVQALEMPPKGKPQPTAAERNAFLTYLERELGQNDCTGTHNPGRVTLRRLNRAEYNATIRDLVGVDFQPADDFPADDSGYGFDNIGDVLSLPPILLEKYLAAADKVLDTAFTPVSVETLKVVDYFSLNNTAKERPRFTGFRNANLHGMASSGEVNGEVRLLRPGEYEFKARALAESPDEPLQMTFRFEGRDVKTVPVPVRPRPQAYDVKVKVDQPGRHTIAVAFANPSADPKAEKARKLFVGQLEVRGPLNVPPEPPPAYGRVMIAEPSATLWKEEAARRILSAFARKAYRRPVQPPEVDRLLKLFRMAQADGEPFDKSIKLALSAVLVSPHFLFRVELDRPPTRADGAYAVSDLELASRLSYFLWSSMPDDELLQLADQGKLRQGDNLERQVRRMLADPKSRALVENFAGQWLQTRNIYSVSPDADQFRAFNDRLRKSMAREAELFVEAVVREDRSILDFLDSDFTYVNGPLAQLYGFPSVFGDQFVRVSTKGTHRGGVLTMAAVLTVTSNPTRTSPVKRGKWVLENILGTPPPPPPPDAGDLPEDKNSVAKGSLRQRMELHRKNPNCASCHARMDPLGFGLENFDAVGAWRGKDGSFAIDPSGVLPSGQTFQGPDDLKKVLQGKAEQFRRCLTEKLLTYALGRGLEQFDRCAVDQISQAVEADGNRWSRLVLEIVKSDAFQMRRAKKG